MLKNYKGGYKYQLTKGYTYELTADEYLANTDWIAIQQGSKGSKAQLNIKKGYAWDGPSGPTYDTDSFMQGSLVHDALYQLMREGKIPAKRRKYADKLLYKICRADGMNWFRAQLVYRAVRLFGEKNALPKS